MPVGVIPALIMGGAAVGGQVAGAKIASSAAKKAAATQQAGAERALALQERLYNEAQPRYQPYQQVGQQALQNLPGLAGNVPYGQYGLSLSGMNRYAMGAPPPAARSQPGGWQGAVLRQGGARFASGMPEQAGGGGLVTIQAPTGATKQVPAAEASHWVSKGAKVIG